jgi:MarR family transcriptional regulator, organic hydroperoxide resistance regulator
MPHPFLASIHRAWRYIGNYLEQGGLPLGISGSEAHLLSYLVVYSPCPVGKIVEALGIKPSTLTSILKRLEKAKVVARRVDPQDRRSYLLELTPEGAIIAEQIHRRLEAFESEIRLRTSEEEVEGFVAVMQAVNEVTSQSGFEESA